MHRKWHITSQRLVRLRLSALHPAVRCLQVLSLLCVGVASDFIAAEVIEPPERVVFGGDLAYPPFEWLESGSPRGFNIDYARALGNLTRVEVEHRLALWPDTVSALEEGKVDVVPMFISPDRLNKFLFTPPFHYIDHAIYAREGAEPVYSVSDLSGRRVAVEERSYAEHQLRNEMIEAVVVATGNTASALTKVTAGGAEYAVLAAPIADRLIQKNNLPLKRLGPPFWPRGYAYAVRRDRPDLHAWLEETLKLAIATGTYQEVYDDWQHQLQYAAADSSRILRFSFLILLGLACVTAIVSVWSWSLRSKINVRTQDLQHALRRAKEAEHSARHLANFDVSTGLAKPHHFATLVDEAICQDTGAEKELLVVQLKNLDGVVGALGQEYSEELIKDFASELKNLSQAPCSYFGRAVFAVFADRHRVREIFEHLSDQQNVSYRYLTGGAASYPDHGNNSAELIRCAETALAHNAITGLRSSLWNPSMEPDELDLEIVSAFRDARIDGLSSVFQPQIDLQTGNLVAAEGLVRWNHPVIGAIPPARFVPLIEKAGLISQVTAMMIDEAVLLSSNLRRLGSPLIISINVAVYDLVSTDIITLVAEALERHGGLAADLKLELTETSFASDTGHIKDVLRKLSEFGVCVSIDDFGTGYSSLTYLSALPVQEIKIDRTFVCDMAANSKHRSIVRSTILLAEHLGLQCVAEGAEDEGTVQLLKDYGCHRVQGYVVSRPLPKCDFLDFVKQTRPH